MSKFIFLHLNNISPNLFFFRKFQLCPFYTSLKRSFRVQAITAECVISKGHIHTFSLSHIHIHVFSGLNFFGNGICQHFNSMFLLCSACTFFSNNILMETFLLNFAYEFGECCATVTPFRNSK